MRIVVSNPDTLGDFVLRQPLFAALHRAGHELLLIVRPVVAPLVPFVAPFAQTAVLPANPYQVDVETHWNIFEPLEAAVKQFKPDIFAVAPYLWTNVEEHFSKLLPAVRFAGLSGRNAGIAPTRGLALAGGRGFDLLASVPEALPELEKNQSLASVILSQPELKLADPAIALTPNAEILARAALENLGLRPGDYHAVCVGGTMNVSIKTWPSGNWAELLTAWTRKHDKHILFTGLGSELPAIDATLARMNSGKARAFQWTDSDGTRLETLIGLLGLSNGYIGHDTGPMHLAAALGKPVFAIFGGGHWPRFLPAARAYRVATVGVPCVGCGWNCPFEKAYCVKSLSIPDALAELNSLTETNEDRREFRAVKPSHELAEEMLEESARLSARGAQELYVKNSTVLQRESEIAVLKKLLGETGNEAESNRKAAEERLQVMQALDVELQRLKEEVASLHALEAELKWLKDKHATLQVRSEETTKALDHQKHAYSLMEADRHAWVALYRALEAKEKRHTELYWYERIWDTTKRIGKFAVYGRQYTRKLEEPPLPSITIVTPVFNCAEYVRDTIESVLNQNYPRLEYIVVDGGSTDGTLKIIEEYKGRIAKIISEPDNGMYDAIGKGFDNSSGEVLAYLNADDMYEPGALVRVGDYFRRHLKAGVIYHEDTVASNGWRFANLAQPHVDVFDLFKGHNLFQDGVFFRRKEYIASGGVRRNLRRAGDWALWLDMALWFKFHRVNGHVSAFRIRPGQISSNMEAYKKEQDEFRAQFKTQLNAKRKLKRLPARAWKTFRNLKECLFKPREFFYPADFPNMPPPPGKEPDLRANPPVCPLSGEPPERLLLSARHPMLGELDINHIYFKESSRIALNHPMPDDAQWKKLRASKYAVPPVDYSNPPVGLALPAAPYASPYAKSPLRENFAEKFLRKTFCARFRPNGEFATHDAAIVGNALRNMCGLFDPRDERVRFLDANCLDGALLNAVAGATVWQRAGVESDSVMAAAARAQGHRVSECHLDDAPFEFSIKERFNLIHLGAGLPYLPNPVKTIFALQNLLAPCGLLLIGSPNLDSKQAAWFGPAWSHWHLTRFHALYSRRAFEQLAERTNMAIARANSFSHAEWTAFSMHFQVHGLAWSVPHIADIPQNALNEAGRQIRLTKNVWDFRGRGDFLMAALRKI